MTPAWVALVVAAELGMTPAWVALVVAAAGLIGTLAGVLLTQRQARAREDANWKRERERERDRWRREDAARTFDHRREAYFGYYVLIRETAMQIHNHAIGIGDPPKHDDRMEFRWQLPVYRELQLLKLYATPPVFAAAQSAYAALWDWGSKTPYGHLDTDYAGREKKFDDAQNALVDAIRRDLRIPSDMELGGPNDGDDSHEQTGRA